MKTKDKIYTGRNITGNADKSKGGDFPLLFFPEL